MIIEKMNFVVSRKGINLSACEPDCDTGSWECDPDYCRPETSEICGPDVEGYDFLSSTY